MIDKDQQFTLDLGDPIGKPKTEEPNPMVLAFGHGPAGRTCNTCERLQQHETTRSVYDTCGIRNAGKEPPLKHGSHWNACRKYQAAEKPWMS